MSERERMVERAQTVVAIPLSAEASRYLNGALLGHDLRRGELADIEAAFQALEGAARADERARWMRSNGGLVAEVERTIQRRVDAVCREWAGYPASYPRQAFIEDVRKAVRGG